jgi:hypothetical protein
VIDVAMFVMQLAFGLFLMILLVPLAIAAALLVICACVGVVDWMRERHHA